MARTWTTTNNVNLPARKVAHKAGYDAAMRGEPCVPPAEHARAYLTGYADGLADRPDRDLPASAPGL